MMPDISMCTKKDCPSLPVTCNGICHARGDYQRRFFMLPILQTKSVLTMSSREIADLVDTTHDSVLKTIRDYKSRGVVSGNETTYTHSQNKQTYPEFILNKRDTLLIASGVKHNDNLE